MRTPYRFTLTEEDKYSDDFRAPSLLKDGASTLRESDDTPGQVQRPGGKACQHLHEEVAEMGQMTCYCRECGQEQLFDQPHEGRGRCPDVPDGDCPEWACTGCGAALFIGLPDLAAGPAGRAGLLDWPGRVA